MPAGDDPKETPLCKEADGSYSIRYDVANSYMPPGPNKALLYKSLLFTYEGRSFAMYGNDAIRDFDGIVLCRDGDVFKYDEASRTASCELPDGTLSLAAAPKTDPVYAAAFFSKVNVYDHLEGGTCPAASVTQTRQGKTADGKFAVATCVLSVKEYAFHKWELTQACTTGYPTKDGSVFVCPDAG